MPVLQLCAGHAFEWLRRSWAFKEVGDSVAVVYYGLGLAIAATAIWAISNLLLKKVASSIGNVYLSLIILGAGIAPTAAAMLIFPSQTSTIVVELAAVAGAFLAFGYLLFLKSLETEQASDTFATTMLQSVLIALFGVFALGETFTTSDVLGSVLIIAGILLVSMAVGFRPNKRLVPALFGNVSWAFFWIIAAYSAAVYGNAFPLLTYSRVIATLVVLLFLFIAPAKQAERTASRNSTIIVLGISAGILAGIGNVAFDLLAKAQFLAVGSMVTALSPIVVVILAHFALKEHFAKKQALGIAIATIGAIVMVL